MLADNMALRHSRESSTEREPKKFTSHCKDEQKRFNNTTAVILVL